ncbi:MAG: hypothetical protein K9M99_07875 [Candidatus Cloacimonetes bacterium]|nr:hypothetical protein [Candidatus Cloacimonadota bacterium]
MKVNLNQKGILVVLTLIIAFSLPYLSFAKANPADYIVQNLKVSDVPEDGGGGLIVSWAPLPKERRIIEYRVYRGVNADTLFYIGKIDVNLKTGIAGDSVFFYDSGWLGFVDLESPARLKEEKGKRSDRTLYREFPRDMRVNGPELNENYVVLGIGQEKEYFHHAEKVERETDEGESEVYSGLRLNQFDAMYKQLHADKEYFYTVVAVDEARHYYPEAEPASGIPRENSPEKPKDLMAVFVEDANRLQFEWKLPVEPDPVNGYTVWMLAKEDEADFELYKAEQKLKEKNKLARLEDSEIAEMETVYQNPAFQIFGAESSVYTDLIHGSVDIIDGVISYNGNDYSVAPADLEDYDFIFAFEGREFNSWSNYAEISRTTSADLPFVQPINENTVFIVTDRIEDKGDYNTISWGKPIVTLTNTTYTNEKRSKLLINYEYVTNKEYKVKKILFKIYDEAGSLIKEINEYYQDNQITVKLPEGADPHQSLRVEITLTCKPDLGDYVILQDLKFNDFTRALAPTKELYINGIDVSQYNYYIYKRNYTDKVFRLSKKFGPTQREYNDNISHTNNFSLLVGEYDLEKNLYLVNPSFSLYREEGETEVQRGSMISTNIWRSEADKQITDIQQNIEKYTIMADTIAVEDKENVLNYVEQLKSQLAAIESDPILAQAAQITDDKKRLTFLRNQRNIAKRAFEYRMVLTDDKGHFTSMDIYVNPEGTNEDERYAFFGGVGTNHFYPRSNWFKWNMFPALLATLLFGGLVFVMIKKARTTDLYIRPIAGIQEIDNAIGRATEMGRPILFVPGLSSIGDVATLAGLSILGRVAKKAAEYDTKILCPVRDYIVLPIAQEIIKEAHYEAGRPDSYDKNSAFFITTAQFAFVAGVNGIMLREKTATNFYMGMFWAEALIMTETGSGTGAIQIAGTDAVTQIPFFITTCDYTLIGEELYAASAYLAREPLMLGTLKGQDYLKLIITIFIIAGTLLSTLHLTFLINAFPDK